MLYKTKISCKCVFFLYIKYIPIAVCDVFLDLANWLERDNGSIHVMFSINLFERKAELCPRQSGRIKKYLNPQRVYGSRWL